MKSISGSVAIVLVILRGTAKIIAAAGGKSGPLRYWAASFRGLRRAPICHDPKLSSTGSERLRPALGRVLPPFLSSIGSHVEHPVTATHRLAPAAGRPVRFKHAVAVTQVADLHPEVAPCKQPLLRLLGYGVPRHVPVHELAVAITLVIRSLAEDGVRDTARVQVRQLQRLARVERAAYALVGRRAACVPHVIRRKKLGAALKCLEQRHGAGPSNERRGGIHLDSWEPAASGSDGITLAGVSFLPNPERSNLGFPGLPIDDRWRCGHSYFLASLEPENWVPGLSIWLA